MIISLNQLQEFNPDLVTSFIKQIEFGYKIHQFCFDTNFKVGEEINFKLNDFDVLERSKYNMIDSEESDVPFKCKKIERFEVYVKPILKGHHSYKSDVKDQFEFRLKIGSMYFNNEDLLNLVVIASGFPDAVTFVKYFYFISMKKGTEKLKGQLIHWTDNAYNY